MNRRLREIPWICYGIGCGVSQSLMSVGGFAFAAAGAWGAWTLISRPETKQSWRYAAWAALLWVCFSTINLLVRTRNERTLESLRDIPLLLIPLAATIATRALPDRTQLRRILVWVAAAAVVSSVLAGVEFISQGTPATAFLRNPIYLAYNLLPAFVFFSELFLMPPRFISVRREIFGGVALVCAIGIFSTVSRMPMTCVLGYAVLRALPLLKKKTGVRGYALALLLMLGFAFTAYRHVPTFQEKIDRAFSSNDPSRTWRMTAWKYNWSLFEDSPWFGVGAERNGIDVAVLPELAGHWQPNHLYFAHSIYIQALADSGLIGTLLFFAFWLYLYLLSPRIRPLLVVTAIAGLTENTFNNSKAAHALFFYALLTLLLQRRELEEGTE